MTPFRQHQDVAVVEHDDSTRQPREGGAVHYASVVAVSSVFALVKYETSTRPRPGLLFVTPSGWLARDEYRWRLVQLCTRCERPILGTPHTDPSDPLHRQYCGEECRDDDASAWAGQHYGGAVAT